MVLVETRNLSATSLGLNHCLGIFFSSSGLETFGVPFSPNFPKRSSFIKLCVRCVVCVWCCVFDVATN